MPPWAATGSLNKYNYGRASGLSQSAAVLLALDVSESLPTHTHERPRRHHSNYCCRSRFAKGLQQTTRLKLHENYSASSIGPRTTGCRVVVNKLWLCDILARVGASSASARQQWFVSNFARAKRRMRIEDETHHRVAVA